MEVRHHHGHGHGGGVPQSFHRASLLRDLIYVRKRSLEGYAPRAVQSSNVKHLGIPEAKRGGEGDSGTLKGVKLCRHSTRHEHVAETKQPEFLYYSDSDSNDESESTTSSKRRHREKDAGSFSLSCNVCEVLLTRERFGHGQRFTSHRIASEYATRHLLSSSNMLKEYPRSMKTLNKVFCSQWLSHRQVVFGTKCNSLMVYDVNTHHMEHIPSLHGSRERSNRGVSSNNSNNVEMAHSDSGIHAVELNPSKSLLATGGKSAHHVAFYRLPTSDPIAVGEEGHEDCIFDMTWLDDQFMVSGSRDGIVSFWRITEDLVDDVTSASSPTYAFIKPLSRKHCKSADRVRSMCYNSNNAEIAVISLNGYIHCFNARSFKQIMSKKLPHAMENVCLSVNEDSSLYAVGSKSNTDLLDARTLQAVKQIPSRNTGCGIRSVSFKGSILTIGTGMGLIFFWDLRACRFLECAQNTSRVAQLKASKGWVQREDNHLVPFEHMHQSKYSPAIYTHCYDETGTRLFAAGGPLACGVQGNYIGLFQ